MEVRRYSDVDAFLAAAGAFLAAREAEHNLFFGVLASLRDTPEAYTGPAYLAVVTGDVGEVVAVALQTPPHRLILSETDHPAAVEALAADTVGRDLPGAMGPPTTVATFVAARTAAGGPEGRHIETERIFALTAVRPPRAAEGARRIATVGDRDLVAAWLDAFMTEALGQSDPVEAGAMADRWLAGRSRTLWLWEDGGAIVSLTGVGGPTPNGIRIGPVYTPPAERGRGYASALVAAVSQEALDSGRRFCFLFTDAANPTSNHIYQEIGYQHVRDVHIYRIRPAMTDEPIRGESRWPMAIAVLALMTLAIVSPGDLALLPGWVLAGVEGALLLGLLLLDPGRIDRDTRSLRLISFALVVVILVSTLTATVLLLVGLLEGSAVTQDAVKVLIAGGKVWLGNNVAFALLYWQFDSGGPVARARQMRAHPDFAFPQQLNPELAPVGWRPEFIDYLYIGFTNANAFSPTDTMPMTHWAKIAMGSQALISFAVIGLVIARAVNLFA